MSVTTLARLARVGRRTVQFWESGATSPQVDILRRVCAVLGIAIADVVRLDPSEVYPADLRVLAGMTQPELGRAAQLSTTAIGMIERGEVELTDSALGSIAGVLRVDERVYRAAFERVRQRPAGAPA